MVEYALILAAIAVTVTANFQATGSIIDRALHRVDRFLAGAGHEEH